MWAGRGQGEAPQRAAKGGASPSRDQQEEGRTPTAQTLALLRSTGADGTGRSLCRKFARTQAAPLWEPPGLQSGVCRSHPRPLERPSPPCGLISRCKQLLLATTESPPTAHTHRVSPGTGTGRWLGGRPAGRQGHIRAETRGQTSSDWLHGTPKLFGQLGG